MKPKLNLFAGVSLVAMASLSQVVYAADIIKANNTTALVTGGSFVTNPILNNGSEVAVWDATVAAANTTLLGGNLSLSGIRIANPGGAVVVSAGNTLTLGAAGIDMTSATQNLTLSPNLTIGANQNWTVNGGRTLTGIAGTTTSVGTGTGNLTLQQSGTGIATIVFNQNGNGTGWSGYSGAVTVNANVKVQSQGQNAAAFGSGTVTLAGGTIAQNSGSWAWTNSIAVTAASVIGTDSSSGLNRQLKLFGNLTSSNNSGLTFTNSTTGGTRTDDTGIILAGAATSTYSTTVISANTRVRIGGNATTSMQTAGASDAGTRGSLGSGDVTLAATTSELAFTRTDSHTISNKISGSGTVVIGGTTTAMAGTSTQVVTLTAASDYTGSTTVKSGRLKLTGTLSSAITVNNGGTIAGSGTSSGLLTTTAGASIALAGGATTTSLTVNGATFGGTTSVTFDAPPTPNTSYDVFTYGLGTITNINNLAVTWRGTLTDDPIHKKYTFTPASNSTRTWNTTSGTWDQNTTPNWLEGDLKFLNGDSVIFNEPTSDSIVTLSGVVTPASVTINNTTNAYTFTGSAITGNTGLTKSGIGTLTLNSANTFTGNVTINAGTLKLGNGGALGTQQASKPVTQIVIASGGALELNGQAAVYGMTLSGTGISGTGALLNTGSAIGNGSAQVSNIKLAADASIGGTGNWSLLTNTYATTSLDLNGYTLIKSGSNTIALSSTTTTAGTLLISNGTLALGVTNGGTGVTGNNTTFTLDNSATAVLSVVKSSSIGSLTGGGINGGNVTIASGTTLTTGALNTPNTYAGVISGSGALTKTGTSTLTLTNTQAYLGTTTINSGTLQIGENGASGQLNTTAVTNHGNLSFNRSDHSNISNAISGTGSVTQDGSGSTTLSGSLNYSGPTIVNAGKLFVNTNGSASTTYTVHSGASLGGDGTLSAVTVNNGGSLTLGNTSGSGTLTVSTLNLGSAGSDFLTIHSTVNSSLLNITTADGLVNHGTTTFACTGPILTTPGTYTLATYAGTLGGSGNFAIALPPRIVGSLNTDTPGQINLIITGADTIKWTGTTDGIWDTATSNWKQILANTITTYIDGTPGDTVTFDDTASGTTSVTLSGPTTPAAVLVNNTSKIYSISGTGKISGTTTSLTKNGTNTLILGTSGGNDYAGGTTINAGTLKLGVANALPPTGTLALSGILDLNANSQSVTSISGSGKVTNSAVSNATFTVANTTDITFDGIIEDGTGGTNFTKADSGVLTLTSDSTYTGITTISAGTLELGSNGTTGGLSPNTAITNNGSLRVYRSDAVTLNGVISGTGSIIQYGDGSLTLNGSNNYSGVTTISYGSVILGNASALGSTANGTTVASGAMLDLNGQHIIGETITINGSGTGMGALLNRSTSAASSSGNVVMASSSTINTSGNLTLTGIVSGAASLTKTGAGTLTLSGINTYSAGTVITDGTIQLGNGRGIGTSGSNGGILTVRNGTFDINGQTNYSNPNQTGAPTTWMTNATITLGGLPGNAQITDSSASPHGIGFGTFTVGVASLIYDPTNDPGMATFSARWTQIGTSTATQPVRLLDIGDSLATPIEVDFVGGWGDPAAYDGRFAIIQKTGSGTVRMSNTNNFPGLRITAGKFICNNAQSLGIDRTANSGGANLLTIDGGILDLNGLNQSVGGLSDNSISTGVILNDGSNDCTLTIGSSNANTTFSGTINNGSKKIGITKSGTGTLTLSGINTYSGDTTVNAGVLALYGSSIANANKLIINGGKVASTGTEVVDTLFFGATQQAAGTWGATGSGATHIDDIHFSGTSGVVSVTTGPAGYSSWATTNGAAGQTADLDHDHDGVSNGIEYFLGGPNGDTTGFTALPNVTSNAGVHSITWAKANTYTGIYGNDFEVETSESLAPGSWVAQTVGGTITLNGNNVTYTFPAGPTKTFVRLKVTGP